jgi:hypothetical protein
MVTTESGPKRARATPPTYGELRMRTATGKQEHGTTFLDVVTFEQRRAERYRHYLAVAVLAPRTIGLADLMGVASKCVRASDILGVIQPDGSFRWDRNRSRKWRRTRKAGQAKEHVSGSLGLVFPETDRLGAEAVIARIMDRVGVDGSISVRYAVYPDDSIEPKQLVAMVGRREQTLILLTEGAHTETQVCAGNGRIRTFSHTRSGNLGGSRSDRCWAQSRAQ